jgi:hypothetical protein
MALNIKLPARAIAIPAKPLQVPARRAVAPAAPPKSVGGGFATAQAMNEERERKRGQAYEFRMDVNEGGMQGVTIILTDRVRIPAMPYFCYMHRWGFEEGEPKTEVCITDGPEGCPLCRNLSKKGGYEMMLSCIDSRKYVPKKGPKAGQPQPRQKRPYPVKISMIPVFERLYQAHKTFRGMVIRCFRDKKQAPGTGSTVEFVRMLTEAELAKYGELALPIDMTKQYPRLSAEKMALTYNIDNAASGAIGSVDNAAPGSDDDLPF